MVIIVFGLPGSGKSYFASRLAVRLNAEYLNTDVLRMKMFDKRIYSEEEKQAVYDQMLDLMIEAVTKKKSVVVDGTFYKASLRNMFQSEAAKLKEKIKYIEVTAPESIIAKRVDKPRPDSEANYAVYQKIREMAEPMTEEHLVLESTDDNIEAMLQDAVHYLNSSE